MKDQKRILVTGGTGFIGKRLVNALVAHGCSPTVVSRSPERYRTARAGVEYAAWLPDVSRYQAVVHLAGESIFGRRWNAAYKRALRDSRVQTTRRIVDALAAAAKRPAVLVCSSAIGYYGDRGAEELPESAGPGRDFMAEVCVAWEQEAARARELGVRTVSMRTGVVLGREGGALKQMLPPFKLGLGGPIGSGRQYMSWIHLRDLVELFVHSLDSEKLEGPVNATSPGACTNKELTKALGRALHRPTVFPLPPIALRVAFGEVADVLTSSQRCVPAKALQSGFQFHHPQVDAALKEILS